MIKEKRKLKNLTQEEMAEKLGMSLRQYVRIDNEKAFPRRDILKKIVIIPRLSRGLFTHNA